MVKRVAWRPLGLAAAVLTAGCASQLSYDLGKADEPCHAEKQPTKSAMVACLAARERPVWAKDEPATLDLYDSFAAARAGLAQRFDQSALSETQYQEELSGLETDYHDRIEARRKALAAAPDADSRR